LCEATVEEADKQLLLESREGRRKGEKYYELKSCAFVS